MMPLLIASAAVGAIGAIQQGNAAAAAAQSQANMAEYNAKVSEIQAKQAYAAAGREEDEQRRRARQAVGMQLAASAESGAGLDPNLLRQSIYDMEADTQAIRYEGALRAQGFKDQAVLSRMEADNARRSASSARTAGYLNAAGTLLNAGTTYYRYKARGY